MAKKPLHEFGARIEVTMQWRGDIDEEAANEGLAYLNERLVTIQKRLKRKGCEFHWNLWPHAESVRKVDE